MVLPLPLMVTRTAGIEMIAGRFGVRVKPAGEVDGVDGVKRRAAAALIDGRDGRVELALPCLR